MSKIFLNANGTLNLKAFETTLSQFTTDTSFQVLDVKQNKIYDKITNKPTDEIESVSYRILVPELFGQISVKVVDSKKSIISDKVLAQNDEVYVNLNTANVIFKPYRIENNGVHFSVTCTSNDISLLG